MRRIHLTCLLLALSCVSASPCHAEGLLLKDGRSISGKELRRDGDFIFLKVAGPDGAVSEEVVPLKQLDRIDFGDVPALNEARQLARAGDAAGVLEKTAQLAAVFRPYAEIPGSLWADVMRLRLPALAVAGTPELLAELQKAWTPTGDAELDTAYRLLAAAQTDPAGARTAWNALAQPGASSLAAGISWLALGDVASAAQKWKEALRAYLSVEVFLPHHPLLQPKALLGAAKAFSEKGDAGKASMLVEELKSEYPTAPETAVAASLKK